MPSFHHPDRLAAYGDQLIALHDQLRDELDRLREDVEAYLTGDGPRPADLRAHCLAFCSALDRHHTGEDSDDGGAFTALARRFPELRPTIEVLERDHRLVAQMLRDLTTLIGGLTPGMSPARTRRVRGELDGLIALLESHFSYEERKLVPALNALDADAGPSERLFGLPHPPDGPRWPGN